MQNFLISMGILCLGIIVLCLIVGRLWTLCAIRKVKGAPEEKKIRRLDNLLRPFGFLYDPGQDIIYSRLHAWQRRFGYEKAFDEGAVLFSMVIDCEPVYFEYDGKRWLIELWKGQYGMTTGAEIGVYCAEKPKDFKAGDERKLHYESVSDDEMLRMQYSLYRCEDEIIRRQSRHWWLTGFVPGLFSKPGELRMCIKIVFPNEKMSCEFLKALLAIGYMGNEVYYGGKSVTLYYYRPQTRQPVRKSRLLRWLAQRNNRRNCNLYQRRTRMFKTHLDKITFLGYRYPLLYHALIRFTGWRRISGTR